MGTVQGENLNKRLRQLAFLWVMAITLHLPMPVCDASSATAEALAAHLPLFERCRAACSDIDIILLGCEDLECPANDHDDDEPEDLPVVSAPFPLFCSSRSEDVPSAMHKARMLPQIAWTTGKRYPLSRPQPDLVPVSYDIAHAFAARSLSCSVIQQ